MIADMNNPSTLSARAVPVASGFRIELRLGDCTIAVHDEVIKSSRAALSVASAMVKAADATRRRYDRVR